ncbi:unnamed protein product [Caenorhabditis nigoni]
MSSEILKENHHYLKACILYEVLQKKPIFDSYQNFCDTVGKDAMEYPDFEFWFYRFYDGNRDFDYDRSADPEPKTLMDMPVKLMYKIVGNLDPVERNVLRSVNRAVRDVAVSLSPVFEKMEIEFHENNFLAWKLDNDPKLYGKYKELKKFILPGFQVNHLRLITIGEVNLPDRPPVSLSPKSVDITAGYIHQMITLLSITKPGELESIRLESDFSMRMMDANGLKIFPRIFKTEQFKQAKHVDIDRFVTNYKLFLLNCRHLHSFKLRIFAHVPDKQFRVLRHITMEDSPDFLKNNEHYLKSFILNDVLQKEPIFNSYRKLCKLVGQDAIEYPDFEFWFYRFYHGNRDFVYDRSADPKPKSLMDMPVKLMCKIAGNLDQFERTRLRTMNHAIKDVIDSCPPVFEGIFISVSYEKLEWYSNKKKFICKPDGNGCTFSKPNRVHLEKSDKNFIKMGLEHLTPIFKISNIQVNHLSIMVWTETRGLENLLPASCHVKDALIYGCYMHLIIQFLLAMKPRHLESFTIWGCLDLIKKRRLQSDFRI